jgi:peptidoglycan/xylan/chitin deacetylase (PgdA/CDA1 family)
MVTVDVEPEWESDSTRAVETHLPPLLERFAARGVRATLFCTGQVVARCPDLLRAVPAEHELASHSLTHAVLGRLDRPALRRELAGSRAAVESLGRPCRGFRAPYFYMTPPILAEVAAAGYVWDASWASFALHIGYANLLRDKRPQRVDPPGIVELPVPDATPARIPFGLSWYRLFWPASRLFERQTPHLLYLHCDEFLEEGPQSGIPRAARPFFRRNRGRRAWDLLARLLDRLAERDVEFVTCSDYVRREFGL